MLEVCELSVRFSSTGEMYAVRNLNLTVREGERTVLLGETGSGKSVLLLSILRLLPNTATVEGEILFGEQNLLALSRKELNHIRGGKIAYVPQGSGSCMNPLLKNGFQVGEPLMEHREYRKKDAVRQSISLMERFHLGRERQLAEEFPHTLSGGMRQRVLIAMGIAADASLILADEPTKGLDQDKIQAVADCFLHLEGKTILCVSHDLGFARQIADSISVMYASQQVEYGDKGAFFSEPLHPYSQALLLSQVENGLSCDVGFSPPKKEFGSHGCIFFDQCSKRFFRCKEPPPLLLHSNRKVRCWLYAD